MLLMGKDNGVIVTLISHVTAGIFQINESSFISMYLLKQNTFQKTF